MRWDSLRVSPDDAGRPWPEEAGPEQAEVRQACTGPAKTGQTAIGPAGAGKVAAGHATDEEAAAGQTAQTTAAQTTAAHTPAAHTPARPRQSAAGRTAAGQAAGEKTAAGHASRPRAESGKRAAPEARQAALFGREVAAVRRVDTPGFSGITFHEVHARSIISKVPEESRVPFRWTINPYRGCSHACVYCFARNTHTYLDLDAGHDFDSQIVVKVNAPELLRRELRSARWAGEHIAMGTNVDCYQRAEGRYQLMPGIIRALTEAANPFSILTKGTLVLRDIDLLAEAAEVTEVGLNYSVGIIDKALSRSIEPGTPAPERRLAACAALTERGLPCGVLMGPVLPYLSDAPAQLDAAVRQIAAAGASHVTPIVLHLRPGAREWFQRWLDATHPELVSRYRGLYAGRAYAPAAYQRRITDQVADLARRYGVGRTTPAGARRLPGGDRRAQHRARRPASRLGAPAVRAEDIAARAAAAPVQLSLL